jgi:hypothetical protein
MKVSPGSTVALSEIVDFFPVGLTVTVTIAVAPLASVPVEQVIVPVEPTGGVAQLPWLAATLSN